MLQKRKLIDKEKEITGLESILREIDAVYICPPRERDGNKLQYGILPNRYLAYTSSLKGAMHPEFEKLSMEQ